MLRLGFAVHLKGVQLAPHRLVDGGVEEEEKGAQRPLVQPQGDRPPSPEVQSGHLVGTVDPAGAGERGLT